MCIIWCNYLSIVIKSKSPIQNIYNITFLSTIYFCLSNKVVGRYSLLEMFATVVFNMHFCKTKTPCSHTYYTATIGNCQTMDDLQVDFLNMLTPIFPFNSTFIQILIFRNLKYKHYTCT